MSNLANKAEKYRDIILAAQDYIWKNPEHTAASTD